MSGSMTPEREAELRWFALNLRRLAPGNEGDSLIEALDAMAFERARADAAEAKLRPSDKLALVTALLSDAVEAVGKAEALRRELSARAGMGERSQRLKAEAGIAHWVDTCERFTRQAFHVATGSDAPDAPGLHEGRAVSTPIQDGCSCDRCANAKARETNSIFFAVMPLCPVCGNKRCPKGTDHDLECSGSNEPGQKGSIYE